MNGFIQVFLSGASLWGILWADNTGIAKVILFLIAALLTLSIYLFWQNRERLALEMATLNRLKDNLRNWMPGDGVQDDDSPGEDSPLTAKDKMARAGERARGGIDFAIDNRREAHIEHDLLPGIRAGTIVYERLKSLQMLRDTKSRVNVGVLQQLSEIRYERNPATRVPGYAMSLSMLLGMLGTFIGLTMMVGDISAQLTGFDGVDTSGDAGLDTFRNSFQGIQDVMTGVGTAFTTTLAGLVCTIVISGLNFFQTSQKARFFDEFEQFTVKSLLPRTFP
ncbi:MAG: hypothetical protein AAFV07_17980, partial [Bacteroidota bacterium]